MIPSGMFMLVKLVHPLNVFLPIFFTLSGMRMSVMDMRFSNALAATAVTFLLSISCGISTSVLFPAYQVSSNVPSSRVRNWKSDSPGTGVSGSLSVFSCIAASDSALLFSATVIFAHCSKLSA